MECIEARFCLLPNKLQRSRLTATLIQSIDIALTVLAVIGFERRMKDDRHGHHALLKLVLFKGIILIDLSQAFIFHILASTRLHPRSPHTGLGLGKSLPGLLKAC